MPSDEVQYPVGYDSFTRPAANDTLNTPNVEGDVVINNCYTAIENIEHVVGKTNDTNIGTINYKLSEVVSGDKSVGKTAVQTLTNKTLTNPTISNGTLTSSTINTPTINTPTITNPTITSPAISGGSIVGAPTINLDNNTSIQEKDSGGSARNMIKVDTNNFLTIGDSSLNGIIINGQLKANVYNSGTQSISNSSWTTVAFNAENFDTGNMHDNSTNNSRLTIPVNAAGVYLIGTNVQFAANATGIRGIRFKYTSSGTQTFGENYVNAVSGGNPTFTGSTMLVSLLASSYVELEVFQSSGGALDLQSACIFWIIKMS